MNPIHNFTSTRLLSLLGSTRKARIISASALFLAVCAFGAAGVAPLAPDAADLPVKSVQEELKLPDIASQIATLEQQDSNATYIH